MQGWWRAGACALVAALLGGCSLLPLPTAPPPEITAVRVEEQPVVYMPEEGVVRGPRPTETAVWDEREKAWTDTETTLVIELEPSDDIAGYTIAQDGACSARMAAIA